VTLAEIAGELYGLPPGDFTAARNARAKQVRSGGDKELAGQVQALRKPTVAAWAVNALVRHHPDDLTDLLALGGRLRDAQEARAGQELRDLNRRQHELMAVARGHAEALAAESGQSLTDAVTVQLEATLRAAMTDADAADAVRTGLLTTDLQSTGFGPVEVGDALAVPGAHAVVPAPAADDGTLAAAAGGDTAASATVQGDAAPTVEAPSTTPARRPRVTVAGAGTKETGGAEAASATPEREEAARHAEEDRAAARAAKEERDAAAREARRAAAEEDAALAQEQADDADNALRAAEDAVDELGRRHAELSAQIADLTARLHDLEAQRTAAGRDQRRAGTARDAATRTAEAAARRARAARKRADDLR
jgi:hypothetical protein